RSAGSRRGGACRRGSRRASTWRPARRPSGVGRARTTTALQKVTEPSLVGPVVSSRTSRCQRPTDREVVEVRVPLAELIRDLSRREAWPVPAPVTVVQTHISVVFLVGDRAYKLKKPVSLGFLDYSTLELRRHCCDEEVRINRRLAPEVYVGVRAIVRREG